jgi:hypothetical protein
MMDAIEDKVLSRSSSRLEFGAWSLCGKRNQGWWGWWKRVNEIWHFHTWLNYLVVSQWWGVRTATQHSMDGFNTPSCGSLLATGPHPVVVCQLDHNETRTTSADLSKVPLFLISRFLCMKFHALGFMEHSFVWVLCQICCSNCVQSRVLAADFCNGKEYLNGPVNPRYKDDADFQLCLRGLWYPSLSLCSTSHSWCIGITGNQSITGFDQLWSTTENLEQTFMKGGYSFRALGYKTLGCLYVCIHTKRAIGQKQANLRASSLRLRANNRMALQNPAWKLIWGLKLREL